jgi:glycerophosphoryl diester phosphodiesterase
VRREVITCFHLATVDAARAAGARHTGWLTLPGYDQFAAVDEVAARGHGSILPPDVATDRRLVAGAHDRGLEVVVWTVNDPARAAELAGWGVDGCITDRPGPVAAAVGAAPR